MYPHYKDKNKLIAVSKQGRQQLVEQMAKERADLLENSTEMPDESDAPDKPTVSEQNHSPADSKQP